MVSFNIKKPIKKSRKKTISGGKGTNSPAVALKILMDTKNKLLDEINIAGIIKDTYDLLYDILTGGDKTQAEFRRRVLEQLYILTGGNNCTIKEKLCTNQELLKQIDIIYEKVYTTAENGLFSGLTNIISIVPGFGPLAAAVINGIKISKDVKKGVYDKFNNVLTIVDEIKSVNSLTEQPPQQSQQSPKSGGTRKQKKIKTKQIKHIVDTYLQFLNLILYVKKKYNNNNKSIKQQMRKMRKMRKSRKRL
jgi:hypothetical protein